MPQAERWTSLAGPSSEPPGDLDRPHPLPGLQFILWPVLAEIAHSQGPLSSLSSARIFNSILAPHGGRVWHTDAGVGKSRPVWPVAHFVRKCHWHTLMSIHLYAVCGCSQS